MFDAVLVRYANKLNLTWKNLINFFLVTASLTEPFPGWIDNEHGPTNIIIGTGKGIYILVLSSFLYMIIKQLFPNVWMAFSQCNCTFDTGTLRSYRGYYSYTADLVPVDILVNCLITAGYNTGKER